MKTIQFLLAALCAALSSNAQCTSSGPSNPSIFSNGNGRIAWLNASNVKASDQSYATIGQLLGILSSVTTDNLTVSGFGLSVPASASICGIKVDVQKSALGLLIGSSVKDNVVQLVKSDIIKSANRASSSDWTGAESYTSYGGSNDLWGTTWTPADINSPDFGISISAKLSSGLAALLLTAQVDHIRITVYYSYTLPVTLKSFTAKQAGDRVKLDWVTATESNNNYFLVERSIDGHTWNTIDSLKGTGFSSVDKAYSCYDNFPAAINYYRLKQVDLDGRATLSDIKMIKSSSPATASVRVYPNPVSSVVTITSAQKITAVHFFAANGTEVNIPLSGDRNTSRIYNVASLNAGVYYARIEAGGSTSIEKIIIL